MRKSIFIATSVSTRTIVAVLWMSKIVIYGDIQIVVITQRKGNGISSKIKYTPRHLLYP